MPSDPFEALRQPAVPVAPAASFARELRTRIEEELGMSTITPTTSTATATTPVAGQPSVSVYLCASDAAAAIEFYREAFGAVEVLRMTADDGRVGHAELAIEGTTIMLADEYPELGVFSPQTLGGSPVTLHLHVADVDAVYARAVAAGASSERPPADQFHGHRNATVRDPAGHRWTLSQPIEEVSAEELADRAPGYTVEATTAAVRRPVGELGYFTLSSPDVERAVAFYGALFGWSFGPVGPGNAGQLYSHVDNTKIPFGIHSATTDESPHHYYRVEDLAAMTARVRELGGEVLELSEHASGGNARCVDDQGAEFDLWQPAPGY